ncbi:hypothetical protein NF320_002848 [Salmonella enterica]|nr:hypothetical protein [Salmonella enterica subsp. enterica serovar Apapa]EEN9706260.1 hypothetical protein [Salmonella enterica]EGC7427772.1 hypothetical protein [Salmonella enterica]EHA0400887.1 hypothetical protein [Salmonella enterica]EHP3557927.1 hypothetical protein [Salmonella enterica]
MLQNWQTRLNQTHANAFRVAVSSPLITDRFRRLVAQAINDGLTMEDFIYLTEREMKNG